MLGSILRIVAVSLAVAAAAGGVARAECPAVPPSALALPVSGAALADGRPLTILAFGSSSTEGAGATAPERAYPARLETRLRAALPGVALRVVNRGRGGEDAAEMLLRLEAEVLAERPQLVIWQAGANAALKGHDPERFRLLMQAGLRQIVAMDVVLMDSQVAPRILAAANHARFGVVLAELAAAHGASLFSRTAAMRAWDAAGVAPAALLVGDGLHHNDRGYDCVARALADALLTSLRPASIVAGR